jgi:hypothetical protein
VEPFGDQADIVLQERYGQEGRRQDDAEKEPALPIIEASGREDEEAGHDDDPGESAEGKSSPGAHLPVIIVQAADIFNISFLFLRFVGCRRGLGRPDREFNIRPEKATKSMVSLNFK